jgi:hypothetical protein
VPTVDSSSGVGSSSSSGLAGGSMGSRSGMSYWITVAGSSSGSKYVARWSGRARTRKKSAKSWWQRRPSMQGLVIFISFQHMSLLYQLHFTACGESGRRGAARFDPLRSVDERPATYQDNRSLHAQRFFCFCTRLFRKPGFICNGTDRLDSGSPCLPILASRYEALPIRRLPFRHWRGGQRHI